MMKRSDKKQRMEKIRRQAISDVDAAKSPQDVKRAIKKAFEASLAESSLGADGAD